MRYATDVTTLKTRNIIFITTLIFTGWVDEFSIDLLLGNIL